uniref:Galactosylgalactosylxylosylprotein 3-beta-glucuronosyltransferase n=1 Tax=Trichobilharzia regenti TaxID=157069 RepID=A0AA85JS48_TRIRE|nr:unnamed protein product [Trichobilharzia regenti]
MGTLKTTVRRSISSTWTSFKRMVLHRRKLTALICVLVVLITLYTVINQHIASFSGDADKPILYILTATYQRNVQRAELTRICNTLHNLKEILWILVEDSVKPTRVVANILDNCGVPFVHLNIPTPRSEKPKVNEPYWFRPKGIHQRNLGLQWLRQNLILGKNKGVLYIADDDNSYDLRIFEEMRGTIRVSTWPVGFAGELPWEGCVTSTNGTYITSMWSVYKPERPFPIDMAGFAVNVDLILKNPNAGFDYKRPRGMQESQFLLDLGIKHWRELEPLADGCQKILVWHTRTAEPVLTLWNKLESQGVVPPPISDWP